MMEDIFSEELVDTPDDIERVIEGDMDEIIGGSGRESGNEGTKNEDENAKDTDKVKVKRKLGPRPTLNAQRLKGPRGIGIMESFFSDINLKGKGNDKEDLDIVMGRLEHWAHRLFPRMQFDEALQKIEKLGSKKEVSNYVKRIRLGLEDEVVVDTGVVDEPPDSPPPVDTFDQLVASVVPPQPAAVEMTVEQRERMLQNRLIAEERKNARLKRAKELKEKFQAKQAQSQTEHHQTSETEQRETNEKNDAGINNELEFERKNARLKRAEELKEKFQAKQAQSQTEHRLTSETEQRETSEKNNTGINNELEFEMEIDENTIPENGFKLDGKHDNSMTNRDNELDLQDSNSDQFDSTEKHDNNVETASQDVPMEGVDNYPDILLESNNVQLDFNQGNVNSPDIIQRNSNQFHNPRESAGNQPDVLSNQKDLPDILVGRNELEGDRNQAFRQLNGDTDSVEESHDGQLERRENQPDILQ